MLRLSTGGAPGPTQDASLLAYHYATTMAEGRPFIFNEGDAPTPGVVGWLQVMALAVLLALGMEAEGLPAAGFALATLLNMAVVIVVWKSAARVRPGSEHLAAGLAVLSGPTMFALHGQADLGMGVALAAGAFGAAVHGRSGWMGLCLALLALERSEGLVLSLVLTLWLVLVGRRRGPMPRGLLAAGAAGMAAGLSGLGVEWAFGGRWPGFGFVGAPDGTGGAVRDALLGLIPQSVSALSSAGFGLGGAAGEMYLIPLLGGACALWGMTQERDPAWRPGLACCVAAAAVVVVAVMTGRTGESVRVGLAWFVPLWIVYAAAGWRDIGTRWFRGGGYGVIGLVMIAFQAAGWSAQAGRLAEAAAATDSNLQFLDRVRRGMPGTRTIGVEDVAGIKFVLEGQEIRSFQGGVTPDFEGGGPGTRQLERLRHQPDLRFEYWVLRIPDARGRWSSPLVGRRVDAEAPAYGVARALALHRADWTSIDGTTSPMSAPIVALAERGELIDRLDVGYAPDETRCAYRVAAGNVGPTLGVFAEKLMLGERPVTDVGRFSLVEERFRIRTNPGRVLLMVARTSGFARLPAIQGQPFPLDWPRELTVRVDGREVGVFRIEAVGAGEFAEAAYVIPGEFIKGEISEVAIEGPHVSFGYWFYQ